MTKRSKQSRTLPRFTARVTVAAATLLVASACSAGTGTDATSGSHTPATSLDTVSAGATAGDSAPVEATPAKTSSSVSSQPGDDGAATATTDSTSEPSPPPTTPPTVPPASHVEVSATIATGLTTPWGLGFLPDGTALVTERDTARLVAIAPEGSANPDAVNPVGKVSGVVPGGEGGLLGLAVSPTWESDHTVYVYFTAKSDNRVAAITLDSQPDGGWRLTGQRAIVTGIPKAAVHNGGRIVFGPDGMLYIGTGDAGNKTGAQDLGYLGGKILRVQPDGSPAPGNPLPSAPLVFSFGHRNVQGLAFDSHRVLWASEFGQNSYDELNRIEPGANYGWPIHEGPSDDPKYTAPYKFWPTSEASPSGLAIVRDTAVMAALRGERLWLIPLTGAAGETTPTPFLVGQYGRLRSVQVAPDGAVWLMTSNTDGRGDPAANDDRILRLTID